MKSRLVQVIYGSLLGDGGLDRPVHGNSRLQIRHSEKQLSYILYKDRLLKPISLGVFKIRWLDKRTNKEYIAYGLNTVRDKFFTELYRVFYVNNRKVVPKFIIDDADEVALAILIGDDGTFDRSSKTIKISVDAYDYESRKNIVEWLRRRFGIESTIQRDRIYILRRYYFKLVPLIKEHLPTHMWYKLGLNDSTSSPTSRRNKPS